MATAPTRNMGNEIFEYIKAAMEKAVNDAFDKAIEQAVKDAEAKRDETVAAVSLRISSWVKIEDMSRTLRIEITKPDKES